MVTCTVSYQMMLSSHAVLLTGAIVAIILSTRGAEARRRVDCTKFVFAPVCRGVAAKRASEVTEIAEAAAKNIEDDYFLPGDSPSGFLGAPSDEEIFDVQGPSSSQGKRGEPDEEMYRRIFDRQISPSEVRSFLRRFLYPGRKY